MQQILFSVEDDPNIQHVIQIALTNSGYAVECFNDAKSMFEALKNKTPNLFLLDVMLPDMDGFSIIKKLRCDPAYTRIPITVISAKTTEIDKVVGLDLGADDYIAKPFGVLELISRVKALLRRTETIDLEQPLSGRGIFLNFQEHTCRVREAKIPLTLKEFGLLKILMQNAGKTVTRDEIMNTVWGYEFMGETRTLDVHMRELRQKLMIAGLKDEVIETVRGVGYKFLP
jgi:two-component system alkaline phosphatase synthesis response regulator PhoP